MTIATTFDPPLLTDSQEIFNIKAFDTVSKLNTWAAEANTTAAAINTAAVSAGASAVTAGVSASAATSSAATAQASANFKGNWSALTGALNIPASVLHNGQLWQLTANLANVTTAAPGISASWLPIVGLDIASRAPIQPTLDLDFANQRYRVFDGAAGLKGIALADVLTYTGSGRTYTDAMGILRAQSSNVPRIEFDPFSGAGGGLSVWSSRTNLCTRSQEFDHADWVKLNATVTANAANAPDGISTAEKLVESASTGVHDVSQTLTKATSAIQYTASVYLKGAERTLAALILTDGPGYAILGVNLATGAVQNNGVSGFTDVLFPPAVYVGNGWYRVSITGTSSSTTSIAARIRLAPIGGDNYAGNGTSGFFVWGAQLETGPAASPYIPTTTAQVTAPADVASITGSNFSKWFNPLEGTVVVLYAAALPKTAGYDRVFSLDDGASLNSIALLKENGSGSFYSVVAAGGVAQAITSTPTVSANTLAKTALSYKANDFAQSHNGAGVSTDTAGTVPTVNGLSIGCCPWGWSLNGTIARILYFPRALPSHLQALSA